VRIPVRSCPTVANHERLRPMLSLRKVRTSIGMMLVLSCRPAEQKHVDYDESAAHDTLFSATGAILPVSSGPALTQSCSGPGRQDVIGYYSPTQSQIAELESHLPRALVLERSRGSGSPPPRHYYRQYVGIIRSGGRRGILVNAFPREHLVRMNDLLKRLPKKGETAADTLPWRHEAISVCDGGREYWSVEYDLETQRFRNFRPTSS
jgi:hypothetical protein